ncbi:coiled-coil and C2 domain-containing protein 2A-like [Amphibalanus amphitrite]|uniref:coiled-coil and C2 domain-containing protein 2A-like n=1 Tax=Amphibalanus amphitrite TaxID=1232801 RepID=UPI001C918D7C|nr:coiled-coil and C2 domain-containing protein 2A-like [Amphibalanus amphitrite]
MKSVSWNHRAAVTQKSIDESESMLDQIRSRRGRRREAGSQDESQSRSVQHDDTSEPDETLTFRPSDSVRADVTDDVTDAAGGGEGGPSSPAGRLGKPDRGGGGDSPRAPPPLAPRRLSAAGQETFRSQLKKRLSLAEIKGHGRAARRSRAQPRTSRFDTLREGGTSRAYEDYMRATAAGRTGPSSVQAYDFFCRIWEDPPSERRAATAPATPREAGEETSGAAESLSLSELLGGEQLGPVTRHVAPMILSRKAQLAREADIYFAPSPIPIPPEERLPAGGQARDPAEDGIYVPRRPHLAGRNLHKLENRLLHSSDRSWFGEDGQLLCLPDPLLSRPRHRDYRDVSEDALTDYLPASMEAPRPADPEPTVSAADQPQQLQLHVHLVAVRLTEHPLFSKEHRAAAGLEQLHREYTAMVDDDTVNRLTQRLWAVRRARDGVLSAALQLPSADHGDHTADRGDHTGDHGDHTGDRGDHTGDRGDHTGDRADHGDHTGDGAEQVQRRRIDDYTTSIQRLREQRDAAAAQQRRLCRSILRRWRELKVLREDQGFSSTPLRLAVRELPSDHGQETELWQRELRAELEELRTEHDRSKQHQDAEYRQQLSEWRDRRRQLGSDSDQLGPRPQPPAEFDPQQVLADIEARATGNRRPPGEPKLAFDLLDTHPITATADCPKPEQQRRQAVSRCQLSVRTLIGGREVSHTRPQPLSQQLVSELHQQLAVRLRAAPEALQLEVCEEGTRRSTRTLAKLRLPAPASHVTERTALPEWTAFSAAGSGPAARGRLQAALYWGVDEETGSVLAPPADPTAEGAAAAELAAPDPNDPADASLTANMPDPCAAAEGGDRPAPLRPGCDGFLTGAPDPADSARCRLLRLRDAGVPEFRHVTMAPLRDQQVPQQLFTAYQKRLEAQSAAGAGAEEAGGDGGESARRSVLQYQLRIKEMVARRLRAAQKHKRLEDMVREDEVPDIGTIGSVFGSLLSVRRPLNPPRKQKQSRPLVDLQGQELQLLCHVVRAFNVPVRRDTDAVRTDYSRPAPAAQATVAQSSLLPKVSVRPFMELTFQRQTVRSNVAQGPNPTWNQDLKLPVTLPPQGVADLHSLDDVIHLSLQDEVLVDLLDDDRLQDTNVHQRIERRWLAELTVPFSTLYINGRVEGTFRLNTPPLLIGYECDVTARGTLFHLTESLPTGQTGTYVTVFITLEPPVNVPPTVQEHLESMETEKLLSHCELWTRAFRRDYPGRRVRCTVLDVTGRSALVCRYIRPLRPPDALLAACSNEEDQALLIARFVSLIPNVSDVNFFSGMYDLWTTCQEFLDMQAGDEEEHAILLCNFFLYLGKRAYLVLGSGIPEGLTAYVLTDEATNRWLWNPCTGQRSSAAESYSSLLSVGCLINAENVWANTQVYAQPSCISFDVNLVGDWRPLFTARQPAPTEMASVQAETLRYSVTDTARVRTDAERLERRLRDHLQNWRQRTNWTPWNRPCSDALRRMLPLLERSTFTPAISGAQLADEQTRLLANIHATYKVCGVPLNVPQHSQEAMVEALFALGVHRNDSREAEFALAVHMEPYPSNIVAVWVCVAALTRRR